MLWLYRFVLGFLQIELKGNYKERLINNAVKNGVSVWHIKNKKGAIWIKIFAHDFKTLTKMRKKSGIKIHIISKTGLPFLIQKYKNRFGIAVGAAAFFIIINLLSGYVWNINVDGNKRIDSEAIINSCKKIGIYEGVRLKDIDFDNARVELMLEQAGLSWASINAEGTVITVNVRETIDNDKLLNEPSNLKSTADGIVTSVTVTSGESLVNVGDTVTKGQLLVSGAVIQPDGSYSFVKSKGKIVVETEKTLCSRVSFLQTEYEYDKKPKVRSVLFFFGKRIPLYAGALRGEYKKEIEYKKIEINNNYAPVFLINGYFYKQHKTGYKLTNAAAYKKAIEQLEKSISKSKELEIISYDDTKEVTKDEIIITRRIHCKENAIKEEKLIIDTFN